MSKRINYIAPGEENSSFLPYKCEDSPTGGFWLTVDTEYGETSVFLSPRFVVEEILPRLDLVPLKGKNSLWAETQRPKAEISS